jgi:hypothetical protein
MAILEDYISLGMVLQILLRQIDLGSFLMVAARIIILTIFVLAATSSTMVIRALDSPTMLTVLFGYFFPGILVLVPLPMVIDYFNGCTRAHSLGIAAQIKIMEESSLVFLGQWFSFIRLPSGKYRIVSWKNKEFEDLKDLLVSFRFYFVTVGDSLCISIMYSLRSEISVGGLVQTLY